MSFINWGHETPEQKEIRRRMEENMMFEQMSYTAAMAAVSAAGSGGNKIDPAYGVTTSGLIYSLKDFSQSFKHFPESPGIDQPFPVETICCKGKGNYFYYLFYDNDGLEYNGFYFGTINSSTGEILINNNGNLEDVAAYKTPSSLYLEPTGDLIMLDSKPWNLTKNIIRINTNSDGHHTWHGTLVNTVQSIGQEFGGLAFLFTVNDVVYGISTGNDPEYSKTVGQYDIDAPEYVNSTTRTVNLYKDDYHINNGGNYNDFIPISAVQGKDSIVYLSAFYTDPTTESYEFGIFNLDVTTGRADWIKWSYPNEYEGEIILTLFTK
jgi:hypothetical protein